MPKRLVAIAAALLLLAPSAAPASLTRTETALLDAINRVRVEHGLAPLRSDPRLERAARSHTREMLQTGAFRHGAFGARMLRFDIRGLAGENIAWGAGRWGSAGSIVTLWLASPEHRANLLRPSFRHIGIGDLVGVFLGAPGAHVITVDFAG